MSREPLLTPTFLLCFAASFLQALGFNLYLHLPGYLQELGADKVTIGLIASFASGAAIVSRPAVGRAIDHNGRRPVILLGGALNVLVLSLYLTVTSIGPWIFGIRILHGVVEAMLFSGFFTYAADIIPESRRTEGIAVFGVSAMLPVALGPALGDVILGRGSFGELFAVSIVTAVASFALSLPLRDSRPAFSADAPPRGVLAAVVERDLLPIWFVGTVFATALAGPFIFLKTYVVETGIGSMGLFFTAYSLSAVSLRLFLGWLPDRAGPKRVLFPALLVLAAGLGLLGAALDSSRLAVAGVLCGMGHGFTFPILIGLAVSRARDSERGSAMAVLTALFDAGMLLGGPLLGAVVQLAGYPAMFRTALGLVLGGSLAFAVWDRRR